MEGVGALLEPAELRVLPRAGSLLTLTNAVRFLTDHLAGDVYFRTHREGHNLERARAQLRLAECMQEHEAETVAAFAIASLVSCFLTFSYVARVKDQKYATVATSLQLLYLVVFSWSFFYQTDTGLGITGLIVTIVSVLTLFTLMYLTAKLDWQNLRLLQ